MESFRYLLFCNTCGNKFFTNGNSAIEKFVQANSSSPPLRADGVHQESTFLGIKFKCDQCGYLFKTIRLSEAKEEKKEITQEELDWDNDYVKSIRKRDIL